MYVYHTVQYDSVRGMAAVKAGPRLVDRLRIAVEREKEDRWLSIHRCVGFVPLSLLVNDSYTNAFLTNGKIIIV